MAISYKIQQLVHLALSDRILTYTERKTIVDAAINEGIPEQEINQYIDNALTQRLKFYTKEELKSCPFCGAQIPLLSETCLFCGNELEKPSDISAVDISGEEAEIIRGENTRVASQNLNIKTCPDCGAPYPLISNICTNCGHVLHEQRDAELNIKNLRSNIEKSINDLKNAPKPTWKNAVMFYCPPFIILFTILISYYILQIEIKILRSLLLTITWLFIFKVLPNIASLFINIEKMALPRHAPLQEYDFIYSKSISEYEKYIRLTTTLYSNNPESLQLLDTYNQEIVKYKKKQKRNRIKYYLQFALIVIITTIIGFEFIRYQNQDKIEYYSSIEIPINSTNIDNKKNDYLSAEGTGFITFELVDTSPKFRMKINKLKLVASGEKSGYASELSYQFCFRDKITNTLFFPVYKMSISNECKEAVDKMLRSGKGYCYVDLVSLDDDNFYYFLYYFNIANVDYKLSIK
ncbi:MAG: zinc ribbon domain-containing protein [Bacteroidales bacterium]|nr:zinc ribbon domain-containing protein [Bacteroidales bacterium]